MNHWLDDTSETDFAYSDNWDDLCNLETFSFSFINQQEKTRSECKRNCIGIINTWDITVYDVVVSKTLHVMHLALYFLLATVTNPESCGNHEWRECARKRGTPRWVRELKVSIINRIWHRWQAWWSVSHCLSQCRCDLEWLFSLL